MRVLSRDDVVHVAHLARLGLTDAEIDRMEEQLDLILTMFTVLDELDTASIAPTAQTIEVRDVMRSDVVTPSLPQAAVLANAPERHGEHLVVPAIIGDGD